MLKQMAWCNSGWMEDRVTGVCKAALFVPGSVGRWDEDLVQLARARFTSFLVLSGKSHQSSFKLKRSQR